MAGNENISANDVNFEWIARRAVTTEALTAFLERLRRHESLAPGLKDVEAAEFKKRPSFQFTFALLTSAEVSDVLEAIDELIARAA